VAAAVDAALAEAAPRGRGGASGRRRVIPTYPAASVYTLHYNWRTSEERESWLARIEALCTSCGLTYPLPQLAIQGGEGGR
jgi:hypothetical protein